MTWFAWARRPEVKGKQLEAWLAKVLVPVEPSPRFVGRLRARLVTYRGRRFPPVWFVVAAGAALLLVIATVLGQAVRLVVALVAIVAAAGRQRSARPEEGAFETKAGSD